MKLNHSLSEFEEKLIINENSEKLFEKTILIIKKSDHVINEKEF